jgi:cytochrome c553
MFDMTQNNNVINGNLISQPDTEESDAGVCLACGSRDGSDVNDKIDKLDKMDKKIMQTEV